MLAPFMPELVQAEVEYRRQQLRRYFARPTPHRSRWWFARYTAAQPPAPSPAAAVPAPRRAEPNDRQEDRQEDRRAEWQDDRRALT